MKLFSTLAALAAVVAAQGPDAGTPTPARAPAAPQQQHPQAPQPSAPGNVTLPDAGSPAPPQQARHQPSPPSPPPPPQAPPPRVVTAEESAKVQVFEQKLDAQNQKLDATVKELESIRAQNAARDAAEQQRHQRSEAQKAAATSMGAIDAQLLSGDTSQVLQSLSSIEGSLGPAAKANLDYARQALENSDLTNARMYLTRAAQEAQRER